MLQFHTSVRLNEPAKQILKEMALTAAISCVIVAFGVSLKAISICNPVSVYVVSGVFFSTSLALNVNKHYNFISEDFFKRHFAKISNISPVVNLVSIVVVIVFTRISPTLGIIFAIPIGVIGACTLEYRKYLQEQKLNRETKIPQQLTI